jgi:septal ring factor EnvC (AmiA/AmiB activator)
MPRRPFASRLSLALAVVVAATGTGTAAWAAKNKTTTTTALSAREIRVRELRALVGEASAQEAVLLSEIADIEARLSDLDDAVWDLTKQTNAAQKRLDSAERTLKKAQADQEVALGRLGEVQTQVDASRLQMNHKMAALYRKGTSGEQAVYAALVGGAANPNDLFSAQRYVSGAIRSDRRELDHFVALREEADRLRRDVEARAEEMRVVRDQQAAERDRLSGLKDEALANRAAARSEEDSTPSRSSRAPSGSSSGRSRPASGSPPVGSARSGRRWAPP